MIFLHELRRNRKALIIWTIIIAGFDFCMILMYPSLQDTLKDIYSAYQQMGAFSQAFGMDQLNIATAKGFYGMYIGIMLSLCGAMYASILGTGMLSKEEGGHTVEYLFTLPYRRSHVVFQKILAAGALILSFEAINLLINLLGLAIIGDMDFTKEFLLFHLGQTLMHLELAAIGILISSFMKKTAVGLGLGIALLLYFMDMMARIMDQLKAFKFITPFYYANAADVMTKSTIHGGYLAIGIAVLIVSLVAGTIRYQTRDLAA